MQKGPSPTRCPAWSLAAVRLAEIFPVNIGQFLGGMVLGTKTGEKIYGYISHLVLREFQDLKLKPKARYDFACEQDQLGKAIVAQFQESSLEVIPLKLPPMLPPSGNPFESVKTKNKLFPSSGNLVASDYKDMFLLCQLIRSFPVNLDILGECVVSATVHQEKKLKIQRPRCIPLPCFRENSRLLQKTCFSKSHFFVG